MTEATSFAGWLDPHETVRVELTLNGTGATLEATPRWTLADAVRAHGLTGTHLGCEHGVCGACTVLLDGEPVRACLVLAVQASGRRVDTVEGLADGDSLHPAQSAFRDQRALAVRVLHSRIRGPRRLARRQRAQRERRTRARGPLLQPVPLYRVRADPRSCAAGRRSGRSVKMPAFAYARAHDVNEALALLAEAGDEAKLLAGGQSLLPVLAFRLFRPTHVVDVDCLEGLGALEERDGELELGALVRHARLEQADLQGGQRLLSLAARHIGHLPIRMRGTLGGSLAHADPSAELCVAALALDARIVARSSRGEREIEMRHFVLGPFTTALDPDEMIVAVRVAPSAELRHAGFREFAIRSGDFALASVGVLVGIG